MRVLLTSHGSTGDIYPKIRLGKALVDAGHQVRYATSRFFREDIERAGIDFVELPPDWDLQGFAEAMRDLTHARNNIELLKTIYEESCPYLDDILEILSAEVEACDVFVSSYLFTHLGCLAEKYGKPFCIVTFAHNVIPSAHYPPEPFPRLRFLPPPLKKYYCMFLWHVADRVIVMTLNSVVGRILERNGLPRCQRFLFNPAPLSMIAVSPGLMQPKKLPGNDRLKFIGYLRWQAPEDPEIQKELEQFTDGERVPVLNFGSVTFEETRKIMHRFLMNWPSGKKIVIQSGWAGLTVERAARPEIKVIGRVSHDQLFKMASVVIHHGGAGTTASVLHAGVPQIIIPHIADQFFFGREVERLRTGIVIGRKRWPENLPSAVNKVEKSTKLRNRALELAAILEAEDGPGNAVRELESLVKAHTVTA